MSDQIEFSSFYRLLNSIKEGDSEKISLLDEKINEFKNGNNSKSFLDELGSLYLSIGITELYNFTNTKDLQEIGNIDKEGWETLSSKNQQELPVYLANKTYCITDTIFCFTTNKDFFTITNNSIINFYIIIIFYFGNIIICFFKYLWMR